MKKGSEIWKNNNKYNNFKEKKQWMMTEKVRLVYKQFIVKLDLKNLLRVYLR